MYYYYINIYLQMQSHLQDGTHTHKEIHEKHKDLKTVHTLFYVSHTRTHTPLHTFTPHYTTSTRLHTPLHTSTPHYTPSTPHYTPPHTTTPPPHPTTTPP